MTLAMCCIGSAEVAHLQVCEIILYNSSFSLFLGYNMLSFVSSNGSVKISSPVGLKITRIITTCRNDALYIKLNIGDSGTRKIILVK